MVQLKANENLRSKYKNFSWEVMEFEKFKIVWTPRRGK